MKQFIRFDNPTELIDFYKSLDIFNSWKINKGTLNSRGDKIKNRPYVNELRTRFNSLGFFRRSVSIAEIVSWIDSLSIMQSFCRKIITNIPYTVSDNIIIHMEYVIEYSKLMRIDFLIEYKNTFFLIELRMVDSFDKIRSTWNKKKVELLIYKELIENYFDDKRIYTYALITMFEYDNNRRVNKQIEYNRNQVNHMFLYFRDLVLKLAKK